MTVDFSARYVVVCTQPVSVRFGMQTLLVPVGTVARVIDYAKPGQAKLIPPLQPGQMLARSDTIQAGVVLSGKELVALLGKALTADQAAALLKDVLTSNHMQAALKDVITPAQIADIHAKGVAVALAEPVQLGPEAVTAIEALVAVTKN